MNIKVITKNNDSEKINEIVNHGIKKAKLKNHLSKKEISEILKAKKN